MSAKFLRCVSLRYLDDKLEEKYNITNFENNRKFLKLLSYFWVVFSICLFIYGCLIYPKSLKELSNKNLVLKEQQGINIEKIDQEALNKMLENMYDFSIFYEKYYTIKEEYDEFFNDFLFKNQNFTKFLISSQVINLKTNESNIINFFDLFQTFNFSNYSDDQKQSIKFNLTNLINENNRLLPEYASIKSTLRKILFSRSFLYSSICSFLLCLVNIISIFFIKKHIILLINFCFTNIFIGFNFHNLAGVLRSYYSLNSEILFVLIGAKFIVSVFTIIKLKISWLVLLGNLIVKNTLEVVFLLSVHIFLNSTLVNYLIINFLFDFASIFICHNNEYFLKTVYFYLTKFNNDKLYLDNLLYNIGQGFLSLSIKENIVYSKNKAIKNIFNDIQTNKFNLDLRYFKNLNAIKNRREIHKNINKINQNKNKAYNNNTDPPTDAIEIDKKENYKIKILTPTNDQNITENKNLNIKSEINSKDIPKNTDIEITLGLKNSININTLNNSQNILSVLKSSIPMEALNGSHNKLLKIDHHSLIKLNNGDNDNAYNNLDETVLIEILLNNLSEINEQLSFKNKITSILMQNENFNLNSHLDKILHKDTICNMFKLTSLVKEQKKKDIDFSQNFHLTIKKLLKILKSDPEVSKSLKFTYLGKIMLYKNKYRKVDNQLKNLDSIFEMESQQNIFFKKKEYELFVRIVAYSNNEYLEFMLNDISVLVKRENKKIINQCKNAYLSKSAHELKNPITICKESLFNIKETLDKIFNEGSEDFKSCKLYLNDHEKLGQGDNYNFSIIDLPKKNPKSIDLSQALKNDCNEKENLLKDEQTHFERDNENTLDKAISQTNQIFQFNKFLGINKNNISFIYETLEYSSTQLDIMNQFIDGINIFSNNHNQSNKISNNHHAAGAGNKLFQTTVKNMRKSSSEKSLFIEGKLKNLNKTKNNYDIVEKLESSHNLYISPNINNNRIKEKSSIKKALTLLKKETNEFLDKKFTGEEIYDKKKKLIIEVKEKIDLVGILSEMINIFNNLLKFEKKNTVKFTDNIMIQNNNHKSNNILTIEANYKLLKSLIFNIFYYCYKNIPNGLILITLQLLNSNDRLNKKETNKTMSNQKNYVLNIVHDTPSKSCNSDSYISSSSSNIEDHEEYFLKNSTHNQSIFPENKSFGENNNDIVITIISPKILVDQNIIFLLNENLKNIEDGEINYEKSSTNNFQEYSYISNNINIDQFSNENFDKYFYLYICLILANKLNVDLNIENNMKNTIFKFYFKNDQKNLYVSNLEKSRKKSLVINNINSIKKINTQSKIFKKISDQNNRISIKKNDIINNININVFNNSHNHLEYKSESPSQMCVQKTFKNKKDKSSNFNVTFISVFKKDNSFNNLRIEDISYGHLDKDNIFNSRITKNLNLPSDLALKDTPAIECPLYKIESYDNKQVINNPGKRDINSLPPKYNNSQVSQVRNDTNKSLPRTRELKLNKTNQMFKTDLSNNDMPESEKDEIALTQNLFFKNSSTNITQLRKKITLDENYRNNFHFNKTHDIANIFKTPHKQKNMIKENSSSTNRKFTSSIVDTHKDTRRLSYLDLKINYKRCNSLENRSVNDNDEKSEYNDYNLKFKDDICSWNLIYKKKSSGNTNVNSNSKLIKLNFRNSSNINSSISKSNSKIFSSRISNIKNMQKRISTINHDKNKTERFDKENNKNITTNTEQNIEEKNSIKKNLSNQLDYQIKFDSERIILIVDDEEIIRNSLKRFFKKINSETKNKICYKIYEASNGLEAICVVYNLYINNHLIDFVITDEMMPIIKGSSMISFFKKLANENNFYDLTFISYTSYSGSNLLEKIERAGAEYVMNKPIEYNQLKNLLIKLEERYKS